MIRSSSVTSAVLVLLATAMLGLVWPAQAEAPSEDADVPTVNREELRPWLEQYEDLARELASLEPRIASLEALGRPLNSQERGELKAEWEVLRPMVEELRSRKDEVPEEAVERARKESVPIYDRMVVLLEQTKDFAAPEEARNAPQIETMISNFAFYGSLRGRAFVDGDGDTTFDDSTSRIGFRGQLDVGKNHEFFGRGEVGTNLVGEVTRFLIGGDPGTQEGSEEVAFPLRLAFVGFEGPQGRVSFGKQWSTYYDVAVFTDQAPFFSGTASGTFAAGTDGGISGTGRANQVLQYRFAISHFKFGVQSQIRNITDNNQSVADTWGLSAIYQFDEGFTLGAAYNQVRDGVLEPEPEQSKLGDEALILGARWQNEQNYYAVTYTDFKNHETDDLGRFFSGFGGEFYADHNITGRFGVGGTYNYLKPDGDHPGQYKIDFLSVGASYHLGMKWRFYLIYKFDNSQKSDGTPLGRNTLGAAVFYNFSWGFAPF